MWILNSLAPIHKWVAWSVWQFPSTNLCLTLITSDLVRIVQFIVLYCFLFLQFFDKFNIRHNIAELLEYLWDVPSHRNAWRQVSEYSWTTFFLHSLFTQIMHVSATPNTAEFIAHLAYRCVNFAAPRIKKYRSHLRPLIRRCTAYLIKTNQVVGE